MKLKSFIVPKSTQRVFRSRGQGNLERSWCMCMRLLYSPGLLSMGRGWKLTIYKPNKYTFTRIHAYSNRGIGLGDNPFDLRCCSIKLSTW